MGTPELARVVFAGLAEDARWEIPLVVAQPDKPVGRGLHLTAPPVKREALERGIPVLQPARARDPGFLEAFAAASPDVVVVAAYGQILPPALLEIPSRGCLNVHTSLLPRWRGAAPIAWAILEGDAETGVAIMRMEAGLDTGAIVAEERTPIAGDDTGQSLHDRLAEMGARLIRRVLPDWIAGRLTPIPQPAEGVTYARKLTREDGRLDWTQPASAIDRRIRALNPWPGAFTTLPSGDSGGGLLKIWEASPCDRVPVGDGRPAARAGEVVSVNADGLVVATGDERMDLRILALQREGRRRMSAREFLAGGGVKPGDRLGATPHAA